MAWQPIETAPKDGTWVLAYSPDAAGGDYPPVFIVQWRDDDDYPDGGAWWLDHDAGFPVDADPSHWMPLPPKPESI